MSAGPSGTSRPSTSQQCPPVVPEGGIEEIDAASLDVLDQAHA
jgi:hypothetical protein